MNTTSLAVVAGLSVVMLAIFLATGQQLNLTVTAVLVTGGIATLAVFLYSREEARHEEDEARDELEHLDYADEPLEAIPTLRSDEPPTPARSDEAQAIEDD